MIDSKKNLLRQDRIKSGIDSFKLKIFGKKYKVVDISVFGIGIEGNVAEKGRNIDGCLIFPDESEVRIKGTIAHVSKVNETEVSGIDLSMRLNIYQIKAFLLSENFFSELTEIEKVRNGINMELLDAIEKVNFRLEFLKKHCEKFEEEISLIPWEEREETIGMVAEQFSKVFYLRFVKYMSEVLNKVLVKCENEEDRKVLLKYIKPRISNLIVGSGAGKRIIEKPLGYAGDFEMMNQIYFERPEGKSLFDRIVHLSLTGSTSGDSVRFRVGLFIKELKNLGDSEKRKVLSVASGPAVEIQEFLQSEKKKYLDNFEFHLLDIDKTALLHAQEKILEIIKKRDLKCRLVLHAESIFKLLKNNESDVLKNRFDFIYSAGLYDYLDNNISRVLTSKLSNLLTPKGKVIIGNFTSGDFEKLFKDIVLDWYLLHKTEDELLSFTPKGFNSSVEYDDKQIVSYLVIHKND